MKTKFIKKEWDYEGTPTPAILHAACCDPEKVTVE